MENIRITDRLSRLQALRIADELRQSIRCTDLAKRFVARRPAKEDPKRSYVCPNLREVLVPDSEGMSECVVGDEMRSTLEDLIHEYAEPFWFRGSSIIIPDTKFRKVCLLLWSFTSQDNADARRYDAIDVLGGGWDLGKWRKPLGPEWEICVKLAQHLIAANAVEVDGEDEDAA